MSWLDTSNIIGFFFHYIAKFFRVDLELSTCDISQLSQISTSYIPIFQQENAHELFEMPLFSPRTQQSNSDLFSIYFNCSR